MCGIAGTYLLNDRSLLKSMVGVLKHRGPDSEGYYVDRDVMLGSSRLAIIDLGGGKQPIFNEDGSIVMVYNGEVYNFRELRSELQSRGHHFSSESDGEVIVHQYEEDGIGCVTKFNGMFAFALWDGERHQLVLARDPIGIKPLYYSTCNGSLIFGSEIKAILQKRVIKPSLDFKVVYDHLNLRFTPYENTLFVGIKKLMPGSVLIARGSNLIAELQNFPIPSNVRPERHLGVDSHLKRLLRMSVESHMISDVEIGVFLSGGLDSSTVAALVQRASHSPIKTFCMGFGEDEDELEDARRVAYHLGTDHKEIVINPSMEQDMAKAVWHADAPKRNLYPYYLSQFASKYVKGVLSGLGGDELFGGYVWRYQKFVGSDGTVVQSTPLERASTYLSTYAMDLLSGSEIYGMVGDKLKPFVSNSFTSLILPYFSNHMSTIDQVFDADFRLKLPHDFLLVDDATSMASSIETRTPLLDHRLVEYSYQLPYGQKISYGEGKLMLKSSIKDLVPLEVLSKKKQGFGPNPYHVFLRKLREIAGSTLLDGSCTKIGLLNKEFVKRVLAAQPDRSMMAHYNKIWDMLVFEIWYEMYFEKDFDEVCKSFCG
jgi:asparagine synthase (glutamine-hydrolysing)